MKKALLLTALTFSLLACAALVQATPVPTSTPLSYWAVTAAAQTLSPASSPSPTLAPTQTSTPYPSDTPTPWPTWIILYSSPVPTATPSRELDCKLNWQSPADGATYDAKDSFSVGWNITNTGTAVWSPGSVEFIYLAGAKLYDNPLVHLPETVSPGQAVVLSLEMRAPKNSTTYTTRWSLRRGDTYFCPLSLSIYVP